MFRKLQLSPKKCILLFAPLTVASARPAICSRFSTILSHFNSTQHCSEWLCFEFPYPIIVPSLWQLHILDVTAYQLESRSNNAMPPGWLGLRKMAPVSGAIMNDW